MDITAESLPALAEQLMAERKRQKLSRSQAAAVCNVSASFIRDAESTPERCSLGKLLLLVQGLGLSMEVNGWSTVVQAQGASPLELGTPSLAPGTPPEDEDTAP
ncbi:MAG: helix-turn-helix domain-containing protein [Acidovorax sp.]|uniref:XRE family transcriptional regulator n=1 Tax=Acidovorax sp. TaxID=1872122 RepID=UPI0039E38863